MPLRSTFEYEYIELGNMSLEEALDVLDTMGQEGFYVAQVMKTPGDTDIVLMERQTDPVVATAVDKPFYRDFLTIGMVILIITIIVLVLAIWGLHWIR